MAGYIRRWFTCPQAVSHPSINPGRCIRGIDSDTAFVLYGVPQGSVLGPLLFLIYVNNIYSCINNAAVKLFADDTNLFVSGKSIDEASANANICIIKLNTWFLANKQP